MVLTGTRRAGIMGLSLMALLLPGMRPAAAATDVVRLAGADRIATAVAISQDSWGDDQAAGVVLARADSAADAVTSTPLAVNLGPILLTGRDTLPAATLGEMDRVLPDDGTVTIVGGPAAVSEDVQAELESLGFNVTRLSGPTRFATAVAIADALTSTPRAIFVADGTSYADALLAGSYAAARFSDTPRETPVLLTAGTAMPAETQAYLDRHPDVDVVPIGATAFDATGGRYSADFDVADPYRLAIGIAYQVYDDHSGLDEVAVASGEDFPDALAGGAHAARLGIPLLLTTRDPLDHAVAINLIRDEPDRVYVYGGTAAISSDAESALRGDVTVLDDGGVNDVFLGADAAGLIETITRQLGQPTADTGWGLEECDTGEGVREVSWQALTVALTRTGNGPARLDGWLVGEADASPSSPIPPRVLTPNQISFTTTWAELEALGATYSPDHGIWEIDNRRLIGELRDGSTFFTPPPEAPVTAFGAGVTGLLGC